MRNQKDFESAWRSVWETGNINSQNEEEFFKIFSSKIDRLLNNTEKKESNFDIILRLLGDFSSFIENRSTILLTGYGGAFPKILEWHFKVWKKEHEYLSREDKLEKWSNYNQISSILNSIFQFIEKRALLKKGGEVFRFFDYLKKHINNCKEESVAGKNQRRFFYGNSLFSVFYQVFFENITDSPEKNNIWENRFPDKWKITKSNLEDKENFISQISLKEFLQWAQDRIQQNKEEFDKRLDDVNKNLFPEVEPIVWSRILLFVGSPYEPENRMKSIIERKWNFLGRVYSGSFENEKEFKKEHNEFIQQQTKDALELALFLFKKQFSKENLEKYIEELKRLKCDKDSKEEARKLSLLDIFEKMLSLV